MVKFKIQKNKVHLAEANRVELFGFSEVRIYTNDYWIKNVTSEIIGSTGTQYMIGKKNKYPAMPSIFPEVQPHVHC